MIGEIMMIHQLKHPLRSPLTEDDRRREREYGVSQADVAAYIQMYKNPLEKEQDYLRNALDDESNWKKAQDLIMKGELETVRAAGKKLAGRMRFYGVFRMVLGVLLIAGPFFMGFKLTDVKLWLAVVLGIYLLSMGVIRAWYIPKLLSTVDDIRNER